MVCGAPTLTLENIAEQPLDSMRIRSFDDHRVKLTVKKLVGLYGNSRYQHRRDNAIRELCYLFDAGVEIKHSEDKDSIYEYLWIESTDKWILTSIYDRKHPFSEPPLSIDEKRELDYFRMKKLRVLQNRGYF